MSLIGGIIRATEQEREKEDGRAKERNKKAIETAYGKAERKRRTRSISDYIIDYRLSKESKSN